MLCPLYTGQFKAVAVTAQQDLFELKASASQVCKIHGFTLSQVTKVGDANESDLLLTTNRGTGSVTGGSGGTTVTVAPSLRGATAFGGTLKANNTTRLAVGTGTLTSNLEVYYWNLRVPYTMWYPPECRPIILPADYWTLALETTITATFSGTVFIEQLGV